jgi:hypothetical protein
MNAGKNKASCASGHMVRGRHLVQLTGSVLLAAGLALGLTACHKSEPANAAGKHQAAGYYANLELDNGKKWAVVEPMMVHIRSLEKSVQEFEQTPGQDHAALAEDIQEHLGRLVTNCTMEGKAHDELHKWLMPFLGLSADYSKDADPAARQQTFAQIKSALAVFNNYFE